MEVAMGVIACGPMRPRVVDGCLVSRMVCRDGVPGATAGVAGALGVAGGGVGTARR